MIDYDVIVIGAGPAGCYAALSAAKRGCRVAIFEEHKAIGTPRHDPGWVMESDFAESIIGSAGKAVVGTKVQEYRVYDAESGDLIEASTMGGYLLRRDLLENEIAACAIRAGARLYLGTKVINLTRREGKVEGITTNSKFIPNAKGQIFICADGIRSPGNGFAVSEQLCKPSEVCPGQSYLFANADVTAGIIEHCLSPDPDLNNECFFTHSKNACFLSPAASITFDELKERQDNIISRKIKNAYPVEVSGYARATSGKYGEYFKNIVKDNVMFIGDASGGAGNIHGMIQGQFAGSVAASAIKDKDVTEKRLYEYQDSVRNTLAKAPFSWLSAREYYGTFNDWFHAFYAATKGIKATELAGL